MKLKIVTWNIHKGIGGVDRKYSLDRVAETLKTLDPDVALLQEVADGWPPAGRDLQAEALSELTPLSHFAFAPEHRFAEGGYGNAILSKYPLADRHRIDLKVSWRKQRSALQARVKLTEAGGSTDLYATSLHLGLAESERRAQLKKLFEAERHHSPEIPSVLAGDFNDVFGSLETRFMKDAGYSRATRRVRTFPAALPCFCLDAIFAHGVKECLPPEVPAPAERRASDHRPLVTTITLPER